MSGEVDHVYAWWISPRAYLTPLGLYNAYNGHYATSFIGKIKRVNFTWVTHLLGVLQVGHITFFYANKSHKYELFSSRSHNFFFTQTSHISIDVLRIGHIGIT